LASLGEKLSEDGKADADPESFSDIDDVEVPLSIHLLSTLFRQLVAVFEYERCPDSLFGSLMFH
jgi:hypothetical protein